MQGSVESPPIREPPESSTPTQFPPATSEFTHKLNTHRSSQSHTHLHTEHKHFSTYTQCVAAAIEFVRVRDYLNKLIVVVCVAGSHARMSAKRVYSPHIMWNNTFLILLMLYYMPEAEHANSTKRTIYFIRLRTKMHTLRLAFHARCTSVESKLNQLTNVL